MSEPSQRTHKVIKVVPATPKKTSAYITHPGSPSSDAKNAEKDKTIKTTKTTNFVQQKNTIIVISTPPEFRQPSTSKIQDEPKSAPIEGLQHHFMTAPGSMASMPSMASVHGTIKEEQPPGPADEGFGEKYVDVVDTDDFSNKQETERTHVLSSLSHHVKRLYMIFTTIILLDATFSALAMYSFEKAASAYAHLALAYIFANSNQIFFHLIILMFVICSFPLVGLAIIAFPKSERKTVMYGRWSFFILFEIYLVLCLVVYCASTANFYPIMKENMLADLDIKPDTHIAAGRGDKPPYIVLRDLTQNYYGCCGVNGYEDWTTKRRDNKLDLAGYPLGCCDQSVEPGECFAPLPMEIKKDGKDKTLIFTNGCLAFETRWAYGLAIFYILILVIIISITSATPFYLFHVVRIANKFDIDLVSALK